MISVFTAENIASKSRAERSEQERKRFVIMTSNKVGYKALSIESKELLLKHEEALSVGAMSVREAKKDLGIDTKKVLDGEEILFRNKMKADAFLRKVNPLQDWYLCRCFPNVYRKLVDGEIDFTTGLKIAGIYRMQKGKIYDLMITSNEFTTFELQRIGKDI